MISVETWHAIQEGAARGVPKETIAKNLRLDVKTVRKWIHRPFEPTLQSKRPSKLDPFKDRVIRYVESRPLNALQVFRRLQEDGFVGCYTIVNDYLRSLGRRPRDVFDADQWFLSIIQKKITRDELAAAVNGAGEVDTIIDRVYSEKRSERNKALSIIATIYGVKTQTIISALGISSSAYYSYKRAYAAGGVEALFADRRGRKVKSDDAALCDAVLKILHEPPSNYGINRTSWTMPLLRKALNENGHSAWAGVIRTIMRNHGFKWRKARIVLTSADPAYSEKLANIKSILANLQPDEAFFSIDEYGPFSVKTHGGRKLIEPSDRYTVPQWQKSRGSLILTAALELGSNQITFFFSEKKNTDEMIKMLKSLAMQYADRKTLYLSWDAASWHISKRFRMVVDEHNAEAMIKGTVMIATAPLPSGAQFLNVIESIFSGMSRAIIHNSDYGSLEEAKTAIERYLTERNSYFQEHPKKAGKKIWGKERAPPAFSESGTCKDPRYR